MEDWLWEAMSLKEDENLGLVEKELWPEAKRFNSCAICIAKILCGN